MSMEDYKRYPANNIDELMYNFRTVTLPELFKTSDYEFQGYKLSFKPDLSDLNANTHVDDVAKPSVIKADLTINMPSGSGGIEQYTISGVPIASVPRVGLHGIRHLNDRGKKIKDYIPISKLAPASGFSFKEAESPNGKKKYRELSFSSMFGEVFKIRTQVGLSLRDFTNGYKATTKGPYVQCAQDRKKKVSAVKLSLLDFLQVYTGKSPMEIVHALHDHPLIKLQYNASVSSKIDMPATEVLQNMLTPSSGDTLENKALSLYEALSSGTRTLSASTIVRDVQSMLKYKTRAGMDKGARAYIHNSLNRFITGHKDFKILDITPRTQQTAEFIDKNLTPDIVNRILQNKEIKEVKLISSGKYYYWKAYTDEMIACSYVTPDELLLMVYNYLLFVSDDIGNVDDENDLKCNTIQPFTFRYLFEINKYLGRITNAFRANVLSANSGNQTYFTKDDIYRYIHSIHPSQGGYIEKQYTSDGGIQLFELLNTENSQVFIEPDGANTLANESATGRIKKVKKEALRKVHDTQYGYIDPADTPETSDVGHTVNKTFRSFVNEHGMQVIPHFKYYPETKTVDRETVYLLSPLDLASLVTVPFNAIQTLEDETSTHQIEARLRGELTRVAPSAVDYVEAFEDMAVGLNLGYVAFVTLDAPKRLPMAVSTEKAASPVVNTQRSYTTTGVADSLGVLTARDILEKYLLGHDREISCVKDDMCLHLYKFTQSTNVSGVEVGNRANDDISRPDEMEMSFHIVNSDGTPWEGGCNGIKSLTVRYPKLRSTSRKTALQWKYRATDNNIYKMNDIVVYSGDVDISPTTIISTTGEVIQENSPSAVALGENVKVLFQVYDGFNYEDSAIISQRFADNYGLATYYTFTIADNNEEAIEKGIQIEYINHSNDPRYTAQGIPKPGIFLYPNDVVICRRKTVSLKNESEGIGLDETNFKTAIFDKRLGPKEEGYVIDSKINMIKGSGSSEPVYYVEVLISQVLKIDTGDKESGFHGNKSVVGVVVPDIDMPYDEDGNVPDIILNPQGVIQRENVGQLLEHMVNEMGRIWSNKFEKNVAIQVTPCSHVDPSAICAKATEIGLHEKTLYNPKTGEPYPRKSIIGTMYLTRSTHIASSKYNATSTGLNKIKMIDNQPAKGQGGGQVKGEMEHWAAYARGVLDYQSTLDTLQSDDRPALLTLKDHISKDPLTPINADTLAKGLSRSKSNYESTGFGTSSLGTRSGALERSQAWHRLLGYDQELSDDGSITFSILSDEKILAISNGNRIPLNYTGTSARDDIIRVLAGTSNTATGYREARNHLDLERNNNSYSYIQLPYSVIMPSIFIHDEFAKLIVYRNYNRSTGRFEYKMASRGVLAKIAQGGKKLFCIQSYHRLCESRWKMLNEEEQTKILNNCDNDHDAAIKEAFGFNPNRSFINPDGTVPGIFCILDADKELISSPTISAELGNSNLFTNVQDFFQLLLRNRQDTSYGYYDTELAIYIQHAPQPIGMGIRYNDSVKNLNQKTIGLEQFRANYDNPKHPGDPFASIVVKNVLVPPRSFRAFNGANNTLKPAGTLSEATFTLLYKVNSASTTAHQYTPFGSYCVAGMYSNNLGVKPTQTVYHMLCALAGLNSSTEYMRYTDKDQKKIDLIQGLKNHKARNSLYRDVNLSKNTVFSGRSVIIPNPRLKLGEAGIPIRILTTIFENHLFGLLRSFNYANEEDDTPNTHISHFIKDLRNKDSENALNFARVQKLYRFICTNASVLSSGMVESGSSIKNNYLKLVSDCFTALANNNEVYFKKTHLDSETIKEFYKALLFLLDKLTYVYPVELNRAPTLWRHGIATFKAIPCEGYAIQLHPLCCPAYNADFDGDQMAITVPQHLNAIKDCAKTLFGIELLYTQNAEPVISINQDMVLGNYIATKDSLPEDAICNTSLIVESINDFNIFNMSQTTTYGVLASKATEVIYEYLESRTVSLSDGIFVMIKNKSDNYSHLQTTIGRFLFNSLLGSKGFIMDNNNVRLAYDCPIDKKTISKIVSDVINSMYEEHLPIEFEGELERVGDLTPEGMYEESVYDIVLGEHSIRRPYLNILDRFKDFGFYFCKEENVGLSLYDFNKIYSRVKQDKQEMVDTFEQSLSDIERLYQLWYLDSPQKNQQYIKHSEVLVNKVNDRISEIIKEPQMQSSNIGLIVSSGARGSIGNIQRICGIVGQMQNESGDTLAIPIISSYLEGLSSYELQQQASTGRRSQIATQMGAPDIGEKTRQYVYLADHIATSDSVSECNTNVTWIDLHPSLSQNYIGRTLFLEPVNQASSGYKVISDLTISELSVLSKPIKEVTVDGAKGYSVIMDIDLSRWFGGVKDLKILSSDNSIIKITSPEREYSKHVLKMLLYRVTDIKALEQYVVDILGLSREVFTAICDTLEIHHHMFNYTKSYHVVTTKTLDIIQEYGLLEFPIYTILNCRNDSNNGICPRCFGLDIATKTLPFDKRIYCGVDAAQSIGQVGLQGAMDSHKNGVKKILREAEDIIKKASTFGSIDEILQKTIYYRQSAKLDEVQHTFKTVSFDSEQALQDGILATTHDRKFPPTRTTQPYFSLSYGKPGKDDWDIRYRYIYNTTSEIQTLPSLSSKVGEIVRYESSISELLDISADSDNDVVSSERSMFWSKPGWLLAGLHLWEIFYSVKVSEDASILARNFEIIIKSLLGASKVTKKGDPRFPVGTIIPNTSKSNFTDEEWEAMSPRQVMLGLKDAICHSGKSLTAIMFSDPKKQLNAYALTKDKSSTRSILALQGVGNLKEEKFHSAPIKPNSHEVINQALDSLPPDIMESVYGVHPQIESTETTPSTTSVLQNLDEDFGGFGEEMFDDISVLALETTVDNAVEVKLPVSPQEDLDEEVEMLLQGIPMPSEKLDTEVDSTNLFG